jgi:hypothetical protein
VSQWVVADSRLRFADTAVIKLFAAVGFAGPGRRAPVKPASFLFFSAGADTAHDPICGEPHNAESN